MGPGPGASTVGWEAGEAEAVRGAAWVARLAAVLALVGPQGSGPARGAVVFGANLDRPDDATLTCGVIPPFITLGPTTCTYFTTSATLYPPSEVNIVPRGFGVITRVRVRTGRVSGPMRVVTFRSMRQSSSTGEPGGCGPQYASATFTPPADAVTEQVVHLPVMNASL